MDEREWAELMAGAQQGDQRSYARLLREAVPLLRRAARARWPAGQQADIEDVVQEVLKTLHAVRHTYDPARPFLPWLLAILRHRTLDALRRKRRGELREVEVEKMDETFSTAGANSGYEFAPDRTALRKAVADLPESQRVAIELVKLKEMPLTDAAAASGMSVGALKVATHRAIRSLRGMLDRTK